MAFINLKLIQGGSIEVNVNQAPVIRVAELEDRTFAIIMTILPGKDIMIDRGPKTFATRAEAEAAAEILVTEINAAMNTGGGTGSDYDDSNITDYVYTSDGIRADGLNPLNNVDLENVRDMFHPEDIITVSNIKIGHTIRLRINRKSGGYTEYGVATIIGYNNEDETEIQTIVKKFSGSILNSESQFLAIGTIIKHPDYPKNIYVNTTAGNFSLSNFDSALAANVVRPLQDKLIAGDNITIDPDTNVISASGGGGGGAFHRVRIFSDNNKLVTTQTLYDGDKVLPLDKPGYLFEYGTRNEFDYSMDITEDIDLTYSIIPPRYAQTTTTDFNASGDYTGTESYIILPADKPSRYKIVNPAVIGVATKGDYLTNASSMFSGNPSLYLELNYLNTSNVTDMNGMFGYSQATKIDLSNFDTSNVTNMSNMFRNSQATELDLSSFNTRNVTNMGYMFYGLQATELDLSNFDTSNVTNMSNMFYGLQVTTLDLSNFDTSKVTNMSSMFQNSQATTGYARTQTDADTFNNSRGKPAELTFVVK